MRSNSEMTVIELSRAGNIPNSTMFENSLLLYNNVEGNRPVDPFFTSHRDAFPVKLNFTALVICYSGSATIYLSSKKYVLTKGQTLILDPYIAINDFMPDDDFRSMFIAYPNDSFISQYNTKSFMVIRSHLVSPYLLDDSSSELAFIFQVYKMLRHIINNVKESADQTLKRDAIFGGMLILTSMTASKLLDAENNRAEVRRWRKNGVMIKFLNELSEHCKTERSVSYYAGKLFMSPKYFAQIVLKESGRYAKDWISEYVIREARSMLAREDMTVQQISNSLHFQNPSFFGKYFKKATGMSPKEYQASLK